MPSSGCTKRNATTEYSKLFTLFQAQEIRCSVVSRTIISLADMTISSSIVRLEAILNFQEPKIFCA